MRTVSVDAARRIALGAQGFSVRRPTGRVDVRHFRRVMDTVGLVQLDSVNVCIRTHYMPFYTRLGGYDRKVLDRWLNESGEHFEYWAHEAAVLPVHRYPLWRWKMKEMPPWRRAQAMIDAHPEIIDDVLGQVEDRGPMTVRDLDAPNRRNEPWWGYGPGKVALEVLFANGALAALRTGNFTRLYDLPDRMIPVQQLRADPVPREEAHIALLHESVRHHGIGSVSDLADYYRLHVPTARPLLAAMAEAGDIEEVAVPGWRGPVYMDKDATRPRSISGATLLSPFDPVVWNRQRVERLFGFRYRIEIYVPKEKREYGYYVLPFLLDGELVGRVDLKASRPDATLLVQSAHVEPGQDPARVGAALAEELKRFAAWLELDDIEIKPHGDLWRQVSAALS
jgi:uncharacterized protein YcaQ